MKEIQSQRLVEDSMTSQKNYWKARSKDMVGITKMKAEKQKAEKEAFFCTTKELSRLGLEQISTQFALSI